MYQRQNLMSMQKGKMVQNRRICYIMGNMERNTFVINAITEALLDLLQIKSLNSISIGEITTRANVSRNSFYRNFSSKEDIIRLRIRTYLNQWSSLTSDQNSDPKEIFAQLFTIAEQHKNFFLILKNADLLYLLQDEFFKNYGPSEEDDEVSAYAKAFFAYSTYGFLETWIKRGMKQTAEDMKNMLKNTDNH